MKRKGCRIPNLQQKIWLRERQMKSLWDRQNITIFMQSRRSFLHGRKAKGNLPCPIRKCICVVCSFIRASRYSFGKKSAVTIQAIIPIRMCICTGMTEAASCYGRLLWTLFMRCILIQKEMATAGGIPMREKGRRQRRSVLRLSNICRRGKFFLQGNGRTAER